MLSLFMLFILFLLYSSDPVASAVKRWDYTDDQETGPAGWSRLYPNCAGSKQSPVDIDRSKVTFSSRLISFEVPGYETIPRGAHWQLRNTGYLVELLLTGDYRVKEGGLAEEFRAIRLEFRWGQSDQQGSEHMINSTSFPLELQIIHYNSKYASYEEALQHPDGVAVFVFLFKISERDNTMYTQVINNLHHITNKGDSVTLRPVPLLSLLPLNLNNYYRYDGSLTVPPCSEVVSWTVFHELVDISAKQMKAFRTVRISDVGSVNRNARPVMPLVDRIVYSSNMEDATWWTAPMSPISITLAALLGFILLFAVLHVQQRRQMSDYEDTYQPMYDDDDLDIADIDSHID